MTVEPNLHGCEGVVLDEIDGGGDYFYIERVTVGFHEAEEMISDFLEIHWSKVELTKVHMRFEEGERWVKCPEDAEDAVPFWQAEIYP